jgi:hypothetical protein
MPQKRQQSQCRLDRGTACTVSDSFQGGSGDEQALTMHGMHGSEPLAALGFRLA